MPFFFLETAIRDIERSMTAAQEVASETIMTTVRLPVLPDLLLF